MKDRFHDAGYKMRKKNGEEKRKSGPLSGEADLESRSSNRLTSYDIFDVASSGSHGTGMSGGSVKQQNKERMSCIFKPQVCLADNERAHDTSYKVKKKHDMEHDKDPNEAFKGSIKAQDTSYKVKKKGKHATDGYKMDINKANANTDIEFKESSKAHDTSYKVKKKLNVNSQLVSKRKKVKEGRKRIGKEQLKSFIRRPDNNIKEMLLKINCAFLLLSGYLRM